MGLAGGKGRVRNPNPEMSGYSSVSIFIACIIGLGIFVGPSRGQDRSVTSTALGVAGSVKPRLHDFSSLAAASLHAAGNQDSSQPAAPPAAATSPAAKVELPEGDGKPIATEYCQDCHKLTSVVKARKASDEWTDSVHLMMDRGARIPDDKVDTLVQYLVKNFGPQAAAPAQAAPVATPGASPNTPAATAKMELPEGDGKHIATEYCQDCHKLTNLVKAHKASDEWIDTVHLMMDRGARLPDDKVDMLVQYLAKNFGPTTAVPADAAPSNPASAPASQPNNSQSKPGN
jgi:mono/diheme cytochrome c family protein